MKAVDQGPGRAPPARPRGRFRQAARRSTTSGPTAAIKVAGNYGELYDALLRRQGARPAARPEQSLPRRRHAVRAAVPLSSSTWRDVKPVRPRRRVSARALFWQWLLLAAVVALLAYFVRNAEVNLAQRSLDLRLRLPRPPHQLRHPVPPVRLAAVATPTRARSGSASSTRCWSRPSPSSPRPARPAAGRDAPVGQLARAQRGALGSSRACATRRSWCRSSSGTPACCSSCRGAPERAAARRPLPQRPRPLPALAGDGAGMGRGCRPW